MVDAVFGVMVRNFELMVLVMVRLNAMVDALVGMMFGWLMMLVIRLCLLVMDISLVLFDMIFMFFGYWLLNICIGLMVWNALVVVGLVSLC